MLGVTFSMKTNMLNCHSTYKQ